jgi:hypothetical protein
VTGAGEGSSQDTLERRYRGLLLAYPAHYRRRRGVEILTTLMDAAPAGRTHPSAGQVIDLLFGGLRYRLSPRGTPVAVAVLTALFAAVFGAIGGSWAGWQSAGDLPDATTAAAIARTAVPDVPSVAYERHDFLFGYASPESTKGNLVAAVLIGGGDDYDAGFVRFTATHAADDLATLRAARERLRAAGWRVEPAVRKPYGGELSASRDDLYVQLTTEGGATEGQQETSLYIYRAKPSAVPVLTVFGLLIGGLTGWWLAGWAARRLAAPPSWRKVVTTVPFIAASVLMIPPTCVNLIAIVISLTSAQPLPAWLGYVFILTRVFALLGTTILISTLLVATIPSTPDRRRLLQSGA